MDAVDAIRYLARNEAKRLIPWDSREEGARRFSEGDRLATIDIHWDPRQKTYRVEGAGHEGHDNEDRMGFLCRYLKEKVLPYAEIAIKGVFPVQLHDSYTYLPNCKLENYDGVLTFSKNRGHAGPVLLPDPFQMTGYAGWFDLRLSDSVKWEDKKDAVFFTGTTTGDEDPAKNERVRACLWSLKNRSIADFRICKVAQMTQEAFQSAVPEWREILSPPVPESEHHKYKFLANIRGNTCCWSRVPMIFKSKSLMFNVYHEDVAWYYPLMQEGTHFVGCGSVEAIPQKRAHLLSNPTLCKVIVHNANRFYADFLGASQAALYVKELFENAMVLNAP